MGGIVTPGSFQQEQWGIVGDMICKKWGENKLMLRIKNGGKKEKKESPG